MPTIQALLVLSDFVTVFVLHLSLHCYCLHPKLSLYSNILPTNLLTHTQLLKLQTFTIIGSV